MAILCREINLLFIEYPRTGCTAIGDYLRDNYNGVRIPCKHISLSEALEKIDRPEGLYKAVGIRNPFDSAVSQYHKSKDVRGTDERYMTFIQEYIRNFMRQCHLEQWNFEEYMQRMGRVDEISSNAKVAKLRRSIYWPVFINDIITNRFDKLIRFEHLNDDLMEMIENLSSEMPRSELRYKNITPKKNSLGDYRNYYTDSIREMMENAFANFCEYTGYSFEDGNQEHIDEVSIRQPSRPDDDRPFIKVKTTWF
jgi:hypothetical protein